MIVPSKWTNFGLMLTISLLFDESTGDINCLWMRLQSKTIDSDQLQTLNVIQKYNQFCLNFNVPKVKIRGEMTREREREQMSK